MQLTVVNFNFLDKPSSDYSGSFGVYFTERSVYGTNRTRRNIIREKFGAKSLILKREHVYHKSQYGISTYYDFALTTVKVQQRKEKGERGLASGNIY